MHIRVRRFVARAHEVLIIVEKHASVRGGKSCSRCIQCITPFHVQCSKATETGRNVRDGRVAVFAEFKVLLLLPSLPPPPCATTPCTWGGGACPLNVKRHQLQSFLNPSKRALDSCEQPQRQNTLESMPRFMAEDMQRTIHGRERALSKTRQPVVDDVRGSTQPLCSQHEHRLHTTPCGLGARAGRLFLCKERTTSHRDLVQRVPRLLFGVSEPSGANSD